MSRPPRTARASAAAATAPIGVGPAWLLGGALVAAIAFLVTHRIADPDLWQHLAVGKAIWTQHAIPMTHQWTWPRFGEHEVLPSWLFRALLYPCHAAAGVWGLQTLRWLLALATFGITADSARRMGARGLAPWLALVLAAMVYRQRSELRPEMLAALLLALQCAALERMRAGSRRAQWLVPVIACVWANAHVSYWMGLLLTGTFLVDSLLGDRTRVRAFVIAIAASLAASFVNPFGLEALAQPFVYQFTLRNDPLYRTIAELQPVDWSHNLWNGLPVLIVGWPLLALAYARRVALDRVEWALLVVFVFLGLTTQRFVGLLAVVAAPYLVRDLAVVLRDVRPWLAPAPRAIALAAVAAVLVAGERTHAEVQTGVGFDMRFLPVTAAEYMAAAGVRGHGYNEFYQGGYLLWRFWPERDRLPFIDIHQSGSPTDRALVARLGNDPLAFGRLDAERHFAWVLTSHMTELAGQLPDQLDADSSWRLVFSDDAALLYVRRSGPLGAIAERDGYRVLPGGSAAMQSLGARVSADTLLRATLRAEADRAVRSSPEHAGLAQVTRANVAALDGRIDDAIAALDAAIASGVRVNGLAERRARLAAMPR